jgi:hypothetical protein
VREQKEEQIPYEYKEYSTQWDENLLWLPFQIVVIGLIDRGFVSRRNTEKKPPGFTELKINNKTVFYKFYETPFSKLNPLQIRTLKSILFFERKITPFQVETNLASQIVDLYKPETKLIYKEGFEPVVTAIEWVNKKVNQIVGQYIFILNLNIPKYIKSNKYFILNCLQEASVLGITVEYTDPGSKFSNQKCTYNFLDESYKEAFKNNGDFNYGSLITFKVLHWMLVTDKPNCIYLYNIYTGHDTTTDPEINGLVRNLNIYYKKQVLNFYYCNHNYNRDLIFEFMKRMNIIHFEDIILTPGSANYYNKNKKHFYTGLNAQNLTKK